MSVIWSNGRPVLLDNKLHSWAPGLSESYGSVGSMGEWMTDTGAGVDLSPDAVYRFQVSVRTVVDFLAKNIAQVPLHAFTLDSEGDRSRQRDTALAGLLKAPSRDTTGFEMMHRLVTDVALWDRYAAVIVDVGGGPEVVRIPPRNWWFERDGADRPHLIRTADGRGLSLDRCLWIDGYPTAGVSPMDAIRDLLIEEGESAAARRDMWRNRARIPQWIERPATAPDWSPAARTNFRASWRQYTASGDKTGHTPILEDGMKVHDAKVISPLDAQQLEARQLGLRVTAAFYHVPGVVFDSEGATRANVVAYREQLYSDTLGHWFVRIMQAVNRRLVPHVAVDPDEYVEFNVGEKLRMAFDQQADIYNKAVGMPFMTRAEARERQNLPRLPGTDDLIVPISIQTPDQQAESGAG